MISAQQRMFSASHICVWYPPEVGRVQPVALAAGVSRAVCKLKRRRVGRAGVLLTPFHARCGLEGMLLG